MLPLSEEQITFRLNPNKHPEARNVIIGAFDVRNEQEALDRCGFKPWAYANVLFTVDGQVPYHQFNMTPQRKARTGKWIDPSRRSIGC